METPSAIIETLFERAEAYGRTTLELSKLQLLEKSTHVATSLISRLSVIFTLVFFIFILNIGVALLLGDLLGKLYYGFFIMALFYLVAAIVFYFFLHKWIKRSTSNLIISEVLQ